MKINSRQAMSMGLVSVHFMDDLESAYRRMRNERIRHLAVLDDDNQLVGIISDRDFRQGMEVRSRQPSNGEPLFDEAALVCDYMSYPVETVSPETPISEVAQRLIDHKISALIVADGDKAIGIVTQEDLLKALKDLASEKASPANRVLGWAYTSPISKIVSTLSNMGV
jgi:acetoin utilization protein AcuB